MDWVKLAVRYYADHAIEALPDADTELMFVRGLARAGELGRSGFIPETSLHSLTRKRRYSASVKALLDAGLWFEVDGGYVIANWDLWQDGLDALAQRRKSDRDRKRKQREAERESTESREQSRDVSRDVTPLEGEGEEDKESSGYLRGGGSVGNGDSPPPRTCQQHHQDPDPPPCVPCKNARLAREAWEQQQKTKTSASRLSTSRCRLCDGDGWRYEPGRRIVAIPYERCDHQEQQEHA